MIQKLKPKDRRIFERFPLRFSLKYLDQNSNRGGLAETRDFSAEGIGLLANEELPAHVPLDIWLHIPDKGEPLYAKGEVVWTKKIDSNKYKAGIKLENVQLMAMSRALRILERNKTFQPELVDTPL